MVASLQLKQLRCLGMGRLLIIILGLVLFLCSLCSKVGMLGVVLVVVLLLGGLGILMGKGFRFVMGFFLLMMMVVNLLVNPRQWLVRPVILLRINQDLVRSL